MEVGGGGPTRAGTFSLILSLKYFKLLLTADLVLGDINGESVLRFYKLLFTKFLYRFKREIKGLIDGSGAWTAGRRIASPGTNP